MSNRRRITPQRPATPAELERAIARGTREQARLAEADERTLVVDHAVATGDVGPVRAWAHRWLVDTSTIDAADDESLLASAREAYVLREQARLAELEEACGPIVQGLLAQPPGPRERLIRALEHSQSPDPLRRSLDRYIAVRARQLLAAPIGPTA